MVLQRLKEFIDYKGISIAAFEKSIGMSNASFGKSLKMGGTIGADKIENILSVYPDLSAEWLMCGKGDMILADGPNDKYFEICQMLLDNRKKDAELYLRLAQLLGENK